MTGLFTAWTRKVFSTLHRNFEKVVSHMCKLVRLTPEMEHEYLEYIAEWKISGQTIVPMSSDPKNLDFCDHLRLQKEYETEEKCPENFVPGTTWYFVNDAGRILGAINIRHRLNDFLLREGGHIGYGIRPSERRKGYASQMLSTALKEARALGINRALITCNKENTGSAHTILKNHGVFENEVQSEEEIIQRYWIDLTE